MRKKCWLYENCPQRSGLFFEGTCEFPFYGAGRKPKVWRNLGGRSPKFCARKLVRWVTNGGTLWLVLRDASPRVALSSPCFRELRRNRSGVTSSLGLVLSDGKSVRPRSSRAVHLACVFDFRVTCESSLSSHECPLSLQFFCKSSPSENMSSGGRTR